MSHFGAQLLLAIRNGSNESAKQAAQVSKDNRDWGKWIAANAGSIKTKGAK